MSITTKAHYKRDYKQRRISARTPRRASRQAPRENTEDRGHSEAGPRSIKRPSAKPRGPDLSRSDSGMNVPGCKLLDFLCSESTDVPGSLPLIEARAFPTFSVSRVRAFSAFSVPIVRLFPALFHSQRHGCFQLLLHSEFTDILGSLSRITVAHVLNSDASTSLQIQSPRRLTRF